MSDDSDLEHYKIQLQQVEAALIAEPDNEGLKKLKADLEEVINLTADLVQESASKDPDAAGSSEKTNEPSIKWKVGDRCMALSSKNGKYYEATVDGISEGKVAVTFVGRKVTDINKMHQLKVCEEPTQKKNYIWESKSAASSKRNEWQLERERRRKKQQKKAQRLKQLDEVKELEKNRWKAFNHKALSKSYKGVKKESSIFASPAVLDGKVGVGTCGTGGRKMTGYSTSEHRYKKGAHPSF